MRSPAPNVVGTARLIAPSFVLASATCMWSLSLQAYPSCQGRFSDDRPEAIAKAVGTWTQVAASRRVMERYILGWTEWTRYYAMYLNSPD